jgi:hypothetical protein
MGAVAQVARRWNEMRNAFLVCHQVDHCNTASPKSRGVDLDRCYWKGLNNCAGYFNISGRPEQLLGNLHDNFNISDTRMLESHLGWQQVLLCDKNRHYNEAKVLLLSKWRCGR